MTTEKLLLIRDGDELLLDMTGPEVWIEAADLQEQGWQVAPAEMQPKPKPAAAPKKKAKSAK